MSAAPTNFRVLDRMGDSLLAGIVRPTVVGPGRLHGSVDLRGSLCMITAPRLRLTVEELLGAGLIDIRFDCLDLDLCTSAGLDVFDSLGTQLHRLGGEVRLTHASGVVRRVLDLDGWARVADTGPGSSFMPAYCVA